MVSEAKIKGNFPVRPSMGQQQPTGERVQ